MDEEQNILPQISDSAKKEERSVSHGYQSLCSWVSLEISGCFDFYLRRLKKGQKEKEWDEIQNGWDGSSQVPQQEGWGT